MSSSCGCSSQRCLANRQTLHGSESLEPTHLVSVLTPSLSTDTHPHCFFFVNSLKLVTALGLAFLVHLIVAGFVATVGAGCRRGREGIKEGYSQSDYKLWLTSATVTVRVNPMYSTHMQYTRPPRPFQTIPGVNTTICLSHSLHTV